MRKNTMTKQDRSLLIHVQHLFSAEEIELLEKICHAAAYLRIADKKAIEDVLDKAKVLSIET